MTAQIIPFPRANEPIGTPEHELAKLAALVHARAVRKGIPSSYDETLRQCKRVADELFPERRA